MHIQQPQLISTVQFNFSDNASKEDVGDTYYESNTNICISNLEWPFIQAEPEDLYDKSLPQILWNNLNNRNKYYPSK